MAAYQSLCPYCHAVVDVPEPTGWSPVDLSLAHIVGDGGWSRINCTACGKQSLLEWGGNLPIVVWETFYETRDGLPKRALQMRYLLGLPPASADAPTGITRREIQRTILRCPQTESAGAKLRDRVYSRCVEQANTTFAIAEQKVTVERSEVEKERLENSVPDPYQPN